MPTAKKTIPIKPAAKSAPKPSANRALTVWEEEMAAAAKAVAKTEQIQGVKTISTRNGVMKIDDEPVEGNALSCIVLGSLHENQYFSGDFDPKNPAPPDCYALGDPTKDKPDEGMAPHEKAADKQAASCDECPFNKMGSAERGRGKACKNVRRLIVIAADAIEDLGSADMRLLKVPVMSTNNWAKYVHKVNEDMRRPPWGVVTEISLHDDDKSQFRIEFEFQELVQFDQATYEAMQSKVKQAMNALQAPYPDKMEEEQKPARGAAAKKAPPAKKVVAKGAPAKKAKY
jgi:hypothetical protein